MESLRPNAQRATNAVTLIWIVLGLEIISLISGALQYDLLQGFANGEDISAEAATFNDTREQVIGIVYLIAFVISSVTFIKWFRRAYFNLHLRVNNLEHTEGWAAGSWFVPIVNWYRPYQIMKEMYSETKKLLAKNELANERVSLETNALGLWWGFWIASSLIGQFTFRFSMKAETVDELITSTIASMVLNVVGIPLALVTVKVIKDYAKAELLLTEIVDE